MKVTVQLHAVLRGLLPGGRGEVDLPEGAKVADLLDQLAIEPEMRELVTVNAVQVEDHAGTALSDGDDVQVYPAVAGGERPAYLDEGLRLFNEGEYFLAHETLEEHWIEADEAERDFYQGLIHLAVGFHHHERGNRRGAASQFRKALRRLERYPDRHDRVDVATVKSFLRDAPRRIERGEELGQLRLE